MQLIRDFNIWINRVRVETYSTTPFFVGSRFENNPNSIFDRDQQKKTQKLKPLENFNVKTFKPGDSVQMDEIPCANVRDEYKL